jgi:uncharacterized OB-fold protein
VSDVKPLAAQHVLEFNYTRSLGPTLGAFFQGLRERKIVGAKTAGGKVIVPPTPHDPDTGEDIAGLVDLGDTGTVTTWAWVSKPRDNHPLDKPFAFALITIDGADTGMLHAVDAGQESAMSTGMKVKARWASEPQGSILDLQCFEPA